MAKQTLTALALKYGVSISTMGNFLRRHGVLPTFDGWRPERYDRLLALIASRTSIEKAAAVLGTNTGEVKSRLLQMLDSIKKGGFTLAQLAIVTGIDRVYWRGYIKEGWLSAEKAGRAARVAVTDLMHAAEERPELFDYRQLPQQLIQAFGFSALPSPPAFKLVTCRSTSIEAREVDIPASSEGPAIRFAVRSCAAIGGLDLWVPLHSIPTCPRCGLRVSRFSEKKVYAHSPGDSASVKDAMAGKIGLRWREGQFSTPAGEILGKAQLVRYLARIAQRNTRERERKLKLIEDIERYSAASKATIL